jgi:hypothetical protein
MEIDHRWTIYSSWLEFGDVDTILFHLKCASVQFPSDHYLFMFVHCFFYKREFYSLASKEANESLQAFTSCLRIVGTNDFTTFKYIVEIVNFLKPLIVISCFSGKF